MTPLYHENFPNVPGIYRITCTITGKCYIGSAVNLRQRRKTHFGSLQRGEHHNPKLQAAWKKYGYESFVFDILELVMIPDLLTAREQHYLDALKPFGERGFNLDPIAGSSLGVKYSQENCEHISIAKRGKPNTNRGRKHDPEYCAQNRLAHAFQMRTLIVTDPNGVEYTVHGVKAFCKERGLNCTLLIRVANGVRPFHKGWTARYP